MPNRIDEARVYLRMGMSREDAAAATGATLDEIDAALSMLTDTEDQNNFFRARAFLSEDNLAIDTHNTYAIGQMFASGLIPEEDPRDALDRLGHQELDKDIEENSPWWQKYILDPSMKAIQVIATPQQAMYRWVSGQDIRKAVPEFLQKEAWRNEGVAHEFMDIGDVIDAKTDNAYKDLLTELEEDGGFKKWFVGNGLKVLEFGVDVAVDPMTYVGALGLGGKIANGFRRTLPVGARAALESRIAFQGGSLAHVERAIESTRKLITKTAGADREAYEKAVGNLTELLDQKARLLKVTEGYEAVPHRMPHQIKDLTPEQRASMTKAEIAEHEARKQAAESMEPLITWRHLDDDEIAARIALGPDDAEINGESLRVLFMGGDTDDVIVRNILDATEPTRYSGNVELAGISSKGQISDEILRSQDVFNEIKDLHARRAARVAQMDEQLKDLRSRARRKPAMIKNVEAEVKRWEREVKRLEKESIRGRGSLKSYTAQVTDQSIPTDLARATSKLEKAQARLNVVRTSGDDSIETMAKENITVLEKHLKDLKKAAKETDDVIKFRADNGVLPEWVGDMKGLKNPWGPRRDLFKTTDWLENRYSQGFSRLWARSLYPSAHFPKAPFLAGQLMFREPMRILEERMPGTWDFMRGKLKTRDLEVTSTVRKFEEIFHEAGIMKSSAGAKATKKWFGLTKTPATIDEEKNRILYELLDVQKGSDDWGRVLAKHGLDEGDALVTARDKIRVILNDYAVRLGLDEDEYIHGYISRFMKKEMFEGGKRPDMFMGFRGASKAIPYFLKPRTALDAATNPGAIESLELYARATAHHMYTRPMLHEFRKMIANHIRLNPGDKALERWSQMIVDRLEGRPSALGRVLNDMLGMDAADTVRKFASGVTLLTYGAAMAGNPRYPIMSLLQSFNTTSANFGAMNSLRGLFRTMTPTGRAILRPLNLQDEHLRLLSDTQTRMGEIISHMRLPGMSISDTEYMIRGMTFHASLSKQMAQLGFKSLDEVGHTGVMREMVAQAVKDSEHINHVFGVLGRPMWFGSISKTGSVAATQFTSFPFKQTETLYRSAMENGVMGFAWDYLVMAGQMSHTFHKANMMIDEYVGLNYLAEPLMGHGPMKTSMPINLMVGFMHTMQAYVDPTVDPIRREEMKGELWDEFKDMSALIRHIQKVKAKMVTGEVRSKQDSLVRYTNTSLTEVTGERGGSEVGATIFGLRTWQDEAIRKSREVARFREQQGRALTMQMVGEAHEYIKEGKAVPSDLIAKLQRDLGKIGILRDTKNLGKLLANDSARYYLIEQVRNYEGDGYSGLMADRIIGD